ncbi:MAG TPA: MlaE family lipid ABC transporter permease subunit [Candidatus Limnocylindrales bacterium]|nr:MlaE family lipid ABC transporter permease subunit [Candidatus Limnocylindrales bacterium]
MIRALGHGTGDMVESLGRLAVFTGHILRVTLRPPLRLREFVDELFKVGVLSILIICISGLAVGMVLGLQGYNTLVRFGAEGSLGAVVGLSLIRELGPVLTALLTTGRAGSAVTAEIGTMKATEQLDGLRMMAVDPIDYVVRPKAWAMICVMPLLSALFIVTAIFGGYLVGVGLMGIDGGTYMSSLENAVDFGNDVAGSILKAVIFGVLVGLIATYQGFAAAPTSAGVSAATTSTVVIASVSVLIFDYFITALWGV